MANTLHNCRIQPRCVTKPQRLLADPSVKTPVPPLASRNETLGLLIYSRSDYTTLQLEDDRMIIHSVLRVSRQHVNRSTCELTTIRQTCAAASSELAMLTSQTLANQLTSHNDNFAIETSPQQVRSLPSHALYGTNRCIMFAQTNILTAAGRH